MSLANREEFFRISLIVLIVTALITAPIFILPEIFHGGFDGPVVFIFIVAFSLIILSILIAYKIYRVKSRNKSDLLNDFIIRLEENSFIINNEEYICMICKQPFKQNESIVSCPNCNCYFHLDHLLSWFTIDTHCPVCYFEYKHILLNKSMNQKNNLEVSLN